VVFPNAARPLQGSRGWSRANVARCQPCPFRHPACTRCHLPRRSLTRGVKVESTKRGAAWQSVAIRKHRVCSIRPIWTSWVFGDGSDGKSDGSNANDVEDAR
jgi:hypothetical protein